MCLVRCALLASVLAGGVMTMGCRSGTLYQAIALNPAPHAMPPKASPEDVHVFTSGRPARPYHEVFILQLEEKGYFSKSSDTEIFLELRRRAAEKGCDAIMVLGPTNNIATELKKTRTLHGLRVTCCVYDPQT